MKQFWRILMMAMMLSIVEDDGMGMSGADEGGDGEESPTPTVPSAEAATSDSVTLSREELAQLVAPIQEYQQERAVNSAVADIKSRIGDFDLSQVHDHLKEIHKSNPERAAALNTPAGWELLWKAELASKSVSADAVNAGRNVDGEGGRSALIERVKNGDASVHERASIFEKYL